MEIFKQKLLASSRTTKQIIACTSDFVVISFSILMSYIVLRIGNNQSLEDLLPFVFFPVISISMLFLFGTYKSVLRYIDLTAILTLVNAIFLSFIVFILSNVFFVLFFTVEEISIYEFSASKIPIWILSLSISLVLIIGLRLLAYIFLSKSSSDNKRVVIYGAGSAGIQLAEALKVSEEMQPIAFLDKDSSLHNTFLGGIKILHPKKLRKLVRKRVVDEVLIAMPSVSKNTLTSLLKEIEEYSIKVRILPGLAELAQGKVLVSELKEVDISDLLGRSEIEANKTLLQKDISGKVVLITGAGGSIGSELSRQVVKLQADKVILFDSNEYALFSIKNQIDEMNPEAKIYSVLGSVTNRKRVTDVFNVFGVQTVYHAAAYKHVSIVEENPFEAVFNNIFGTKICVTSAIEAKVETFVLISTDKAVRPTNIMGATKRFSELILQSMANKSRTKITMVRFGNVIGSSGSAIPLFQKQIKEGGPVTVTHPDVVRYFMSIPEAAELVIQAGAMGEGGDVFVLDMGEPVKILELAKRLISLSGKELNDGLDGSGDIEIKFTGLRPGEKLYEELLIGDNVSLTDHKRILKAQEVSLSEKDLDEYLELMQKAEKDGNVKALKEILRDAVSGFVPEEEVVDILHLERNK